MSRHGLLTGLCAASLSLALVAGCSSPVVPPTTAPTADNAAPVAVTPAGEPAAPVTAAPAAVTPATLNGKATFRGEALSGYTVSVLDAQTGKPVELRADLAGATGLAVLNQNLMTDANGAFAIQVVGLKAGQALRVLVSKGNATLETIVTSNLTVLGAKKYLVLDAGAADGLTVDELTTSIAKIARGVIATTRLLSADEAAPILAKLSEQLNAISAKLDAALKSNVGLANGVIEGENGDENVTALVKSAGVISDVTKTVAGLISEIATGAKDKEVKSDVAEDLADIKYFGTALNGALANGKFTLTNRDSGASADATGDTSNVTTSGSNSGGGSHSSGLTTAQSAALEAFNSMAFSTGDDMQAAVTLLATHKDTLGLDAGDWDDLLTIGSYDTAANLTEVVPASGRQQSVAQYLFERIHQRKTGGTVNYTSLSDFKADFRYAVTKEKAKWNLITEVAAAGSDASDVADVLTSRLPALKADFNDYLTWHADWDTAGTPWSTAYFAENSANISRFLALATAEEKEAAAAIVIASANGVSDMRILKGLAIATAGTISLVAPTAADFAESIVAPIEADPSGEVVSGTPYRFGGKLLGYTTVSNVRIVFKVSSEDGVTMNLTGYDTGAGTPGWIQANLVGLEGTPSTAFWGPQAGFGINQGYQGTSQFRATFSGTGNVTVTTYVTEVGTSNHISNVVTKTYHVTAI